MKKQQKAAVISVIVNCGLTLTKFILAYLTASIALLAEAYHSFADILSSTAVLLAMRADQQVSAVPQTGEESEPPQKPRAKIFSSGNWENKAALAIGILLVLVAVNIFGRASQQASISLRYPLAAAIVVCFLAVCSYFLYRFEVSVGKETQSTALTADAHHAKTDLLASVLVVAALVSTRFGIGGDRVAAAVIGCLIFVNAVYVLAQALRSYVATARGKEPSHEIVYEDILFFILYRVLSRIDTNIWNRLNKVPGLAGPAESVRQRVGLAVLVFVLFVGGCAYALSGLYVLKPGEQAIVQRFGKPLQKDLPVGPGLHYRLPWPIERVKKADVAGFKRLTVGYQTGDRKELILWTNIHYLREYSIITGEGPFLDVAMNVHYRITNLYEYLYGHADPENTVERISYQVLRETLGTKPFFSSITTGRDALEHLMQKEIQKRSDEMGLGIQIKNVCFRDLHPPTQVAPAFEDVVSAQEDYETYIQQANGYRKDLLPSARALAATTKNDAEAYRNAVIAQSVGKANAFSLQTEAYLKGKELNQMRLLLETLEEALSSVPKYVVGPNKGGEKPDLWFYMPPLSEESPASGRLRKIEPGQVQDKGKSRISSEEDLIDALLRFQQNRTGEGQ